MKSSKKFVRLVIIVTIMSFFMFGCGKTQVPTDTSTEKEGLVVETPETTTEVVQPQEEETTTVEEPEVTEEETVAEEETIVEEPEEVVESEPEVVEDPGEVTYITDFATLGDYVSTLDTNQPAILIYNETEKYIINMQEGQHYQLKSTDQIVFNCKTVIGYGWDFDLGSEVTSYSNYTILGVDYSAWEENQEFFFHKVLDTGDRIRVTCYLTPPVE